MQIMSVMHTANVCTYLPLFGVNSLLRMEAFSSGGGGDQTLVVLEMRCPCCVFWFGSWQRVYGVRTLDLECAARL